MRSFSLGSVTSIIAVVAMFSGTPGFVGTAAAQQVATATADSSAQWPTTLMLPKHERPEGILIEGDAALVTSYVDGTVFRFDLKTGERSIFHQGSGKGALGILPDGFGHLFLAGGQAGDLRVLDEKTGKLLKTYKLAKEGQNTVVNDLTILNGNLYVTDSFSPVMYKIHLGKAGRLPDQGDVSIIPLSGIKYSTGDNPLSGAAWNANGIVPTPDGTALLIVQTNTGLLYRVDPDTGASTPVDLGNVDLKKSDGLHLEAKTLYAVRNDVNKVTVVHLNNSGTKATFITEATDPRFDTPTALARHGRRLYLTNARFYSKDPTNTVYMITAINDPDW